jgi:FxsC-like protein
VADHGGIASERPYIFLSYAHAHAPLPRPLGGDGGMPKPHPDHLVHRFFDDLCTLIAELNHVKVNIPPSVGFMDKDLRPGAHWSDELSEALAYCRVFVPLYAPRYFRSVNCGQEWQAFSRRTVFPTRPEGKRTSAVVPVLWVPQDAGTLPKCATRLQYKHVEFGPAYEQEGMYSLARFGYLHDAYDYALRTLAKEIIAVAAETRVAIDHSHGAYSSLASAFETADTGPRLRISVLTGDRRNVLPGRSGSSCYGETPHEWQPYDPGPAGGLTLAEHAARMAAELDFEPSIHVFDEEADTVLNGSAPIAPELLLFDRWTLLDPEKRDLARKFDRANPGWVSMLRPWCRNDPQRDEGEALLRDLETQTFASLRRGASKPSFDDIHVYLPTVAEFSEVLPKAAMRAWYGYQTRGRAVPVGLPGPGPGDPHAVPASNRSSSAKPDLSAARSPTTTAGPPPLPSPPGAPGPPNPVVPTPDARWRAGHD